MSFQIQQKYYPLIILALGAAFFFPFLGNVHLFDWDEINFAESAREMLLTGNYSKVQIDYKPFWEKPPLFFWMQVVSMKIWGVNEFAARFPNAVIGCVTLLVIYYIGKNIRNANFGLIWALIYLGSFTPHLYFKSGIIDPTFNLFIFLGIYFSFKAQFNSRQIFLSGLFIGLAVLTKGPVGGLIWGLTVVCYWGFIKKFSKLFTFKQLLIFAITCIAVASLWFAQELVTNGFWFFEEFIRYQIRLFSTPDAGHGQPFYYHFVVVLLGCFPISVFAIPALASRQEYFGTWMKVTFWVVMILFSVVTTKIVHYSSMAYFPVSYLAANTLYNWLAHKKNWNKWVKFGLIFIGFVLSLALVAVPLIGMNTAAITPYIKDQFAVRNFNAVVAWSGFEVFIGIAYFIVLLVLVFMNKATIQRKWLFITGLSLSTALCLLIYGATVVPKIERFTQGAAIDFYQSKQGQNVYVGVIGFKSYAHLFYFQKKPNSAPASTANMTQEEFGNWLLNGKVDKPVFFVTRIDRYDEFKEHPNLEYIKEENGFVFLKRKN
ncbi:ArnT family glycosyltransferase [Emticicia fluvialis]|uniref:ArnT family glycosyltransferase n=1 Tax=Emticicia fluvialis TaxID=2974474 RepID=UPI002165AAAE|nr:glycosyltransferase family 39 protein [Emticicia fluvialis]